MSQRRRFFLTGAGVMVAVAFVAVFLKVPSGARSEAAHAVAPVATMDLSAFAAEAPGKPFSVLFIHHSVGGRMLADPGAPDGPGNSIWKTHPDGGGGRKLLEKNGYVVHEASYGSVVGEATDLFDWVPKFRDKMDAMLKVGMQDTPLPEGQHNQIVMFKSCYPNSMFVSEGTAPGNPNGPELTVWNARAALTALRDELQKHPDVLFVYVTAPPVAHSVEPEPVWKWVTKEILRKPHAADKLEKSGPLAREFNNWVTATDGWLAGYTGKNIVVFDYYDILTDHGASNFSRYPTEDGTNSHPARAGNERAAAALVPFLNRAVRRAGLAGPAQSAGTRLLSGQ